jgi:asparagine synthase (glutamine-hydrolysing)
MCGIAGAIGLQNQAIAESTIRSMMHQIRHRGPDDEGAFVERNVGLGFVRLSILDLSAAGHQPMHSADERYIITFNGEIFNYLELRSELSSMGYEFRSQTDTEVLLNAYREWGEACQDKLNGMWAFVIFDRKEQTIFISRDRYGIKPFYYTLSNGYFYYASEIPGILGLPGLKAVVNEAKVFDYLLHNRTDSDNLTFFEGIYKLPHGHSIRIEKGEVHIKRWYNLATSLKAPYSNSQEYLSLFKEAVELRMRSDVPVGVCLSGGMDSSSITSTLLLNPLHSEINSFSAIFKGNDSVDESRFIECYNGSLRHMHYVTPNGAMLMADIPRLIKLHSEPIPSTSPYLQFKVMELAKTHVKVTIDGQGADEQLAGYMYFYGIYFKELFRTFRWLRLFREIRSTLSLNQRGFILKSWLFVMLPKFTRKFARSKSRDYLTRNFVRRFKNHDTVSQRIFDSNSLNECLIAHFEYKLEHLLKWGDLNSMAHSIESRVPFLDHRLVERTLSLKGEQIISNGQTKRILRDAMQGILPEIISNRKDKIGFATPDNDWFREEPLKSYTLEILNSSSFAARGFIDSSKAKAAFERHIKKEINIGQEIWKWINLELWFRSWIDSDAQCSKLLQNS